MSAVRVTALVAAVVVVSACGSGPAAPTRTYALNGEAMATCVLPGQLQARCGVLAVPESPADPNGRKIDIQVDVVPATSTPVREPIFFIEGGPGASSIDYWRKAPLVFKGILLHHDIVLVDQRGTGASHPMVLPTALPGESLDAYVKRARAAVDGDARFYTTAVAMDDLDRVRAALGYSMIDLHGSSYGATAVQYYIRQHDAHVRLAVLDGGTLLDVPIFELVAPNSQRALDRLFDRCAADHACAAAYPNVRSEFTTVMARLRLAPVTTDLIDPATGALVTINAEMFASVVHSRLLTAQNAATVPWLIHRAWSGGFLEVAQINLTLASADTVMAMEIRCSEAWAKFDPSEVRRLGGDAYYTNALAARAEGQAKTCALLPPGSVPANDAQPVHTSATVLLLNGEEDPQDPPSSVAAAPTQMPNSLTVVVPGQGHTVGEIGCLPGVVVDFFDSRKTDRTKAEACAATLGPSPFRVS